MSVTNPASLLCDIDLLDTLLMAFLFRHHYSVNVNCNGDITSSRPEK